jgi:hypothetical protein
MQTQLDYVFIPRISTSNDGVVNMEIGVYDFVINGDLNSFFNTIETVLSYELGGNIVVTAIAGDKHKSTNDVIISYKVDNAYKNEMFDSLYIRGSLKPKIKETTLTEVIDLINKQEDWMKVSKL